MTRQKSGDTADMALFRDRHEAGLVLAEAVRARLDGEPRRVVVLGIPRGGAPVGAVVADALGAPLDVVVVRKLRMPFQPELGFGAIAADGHVEVDEDSVRRFGLTEEDVAREVVSERPVAFSAVGQVYDDFSPVGEAEVLRTLRRVAGTRRPFV